MRVLFWATTFQGDVQALAHHLAHDPRFEVLVVAPGAARYRGEAIERLLPFPGDLVDRSDRDAVRRAQQFNADLVIVDNHLPPRHLAGAMAVLWHGFGWRVDALDPMLDGIGGHVGDPRRPNDSFRWFATGEFDRQHRIDRWNIDPNNVPALGAPLSDWLVEGSPLRAGLRGDAVAGAYDVDVARGRTVLLGLTWHFGPALSQWGDDRLLTGRYLDHLAERGAAVIWRLHDRRRYERSYLRSVAALARAHDNVVVKFKDESPDTVVDILVSDVAVSNYSSLANAVYFTRRPVVHIDPTPAGHDAYPRYRSMRFRRVRARSVADAASLWKLPFTEHGGLHATSFETLLGSTDQALEDPRCCAAAAQEFVDRYYVGADGTTSARYAEYIGHWLDG